MRNIESIVSNSLIVLGVWLSMASIGHIHSASYLIFAASIVLGALVYKFVRNKQSYKMVKYRRIVSWLGILLVGALVFFAYQRFFFELDSAYQYAPDNLVEYLSGNYR